MEKRVNGKKRGKKRGSPDTADGVCRSAAVQSRTRVLAGEAEHDGWAVYPQNFKNKIK
jgi:hypothetical protein